MEPFGDLRLPILGQHHAILGALNLRQFGGVIASTIVRNGELFSAMTTAITASAPSAIQNHFDVEIEISSFIQAPGSNALTPAMIRVHA